MRVEIRKRAERIPSSNMEMDSAPSRGDVVVIVTWRGPVKFVVLGLEHHKSRVVAVVAYKHWSDALRALLRRVHSRLRRKMRLGDGE